ncbi:hypothetical protein pdam_00015743 [Pocillopora damicornis]|uniref:Uncharacterized protein n=1 Tax=Pocillopora damicornis TaxID=46731 RepID=A0A3M6UV72_POCDA|nr:hypothetical protein pdam_00015743 [Pocillopora damicornis]
MTFYPKYQSATILLMLSRNSRILPLSMSGNVWQRALCCLPDTETSTCPTCRGKFCLQSLCGYVGCFETRMAPN